MIPRECKRLAEVDFPIAAVSKHALHERSARSGHPSKLHLWWARRPLASSRAVLLGLLLPDPADPLCPQAFRKAVTDVLSRLGGLPDATPESLRGALIRFVGYAAKWDTATHQAYAEAAHRLISAAYPGDVPLVVDPFSGSGSIPLEALRLAPQIIRASEPGAATGRRAEIRAVTGGCRASPPGLRAAENASSLTLARA
jgi:adenine-specific DNA methylase